MAQHASLTIRRLDPRLEQKLRLRAARRGVSMEEEAREILRASLASEPESGKNLVDSIRRRFAEVGYVELELPSREPLPEPPDLG